MRLSKLLLVLFWLVAGPVRAGGYDPLEIGPDGAVETLDLVVTDTARDRQIPVLAYLPRQAARAPVILFSHGLGGDRTGSAYLGRHWAARGYVAAFLQHPGSDNTLWQGKPREEAYGALRGAADLENFKLRAGDVPVVLDALARWDALPGHPLAGRLDLARVGISGHSFGAITTQAVSGQRYRWGGTGFREPRIRAALAMSPSPPRRGTPDDAFGQVDIPWMLMTGTRDDSPLGGLEPADRLRVFPALPPGGKYELVLEGAEHSAFTDRPLPRDKVLRNPNHHRAILALSTAFWDSTLRDDPDAKAWLDGDGPRAVLAPADRWQRK